MKQRTYFVAGATGKQGGALARQLLARGHRVRAYTRNPGGTAARLLQRLGAELHAGGFDDAVPLERALRGCDGAYAMSVFTEGGVEAEVRQGRCLVDAARRAGVPHLVHSSMAGADRVTGVAHIDSKFHIERHLAHAGVPYTILAPVFFMENWLTILPGAVARGKLTYPLPARRTLQMVAVDDVAAFARLVLERTAEFENRRVEIAGEVLTMEQIAGVLGTAVGRPLPYRPIPLEMVWARNEDLGRLCAWLDWDGTRVDVQRLRARHRDVGWTSLADWALRQDWGALLGSGTGETPRAVRALTVSGSWALDLR
jgi:uncharacterized protein YbjT (DUF2867 family)